ncbi:MAG: TIGR00730 family Rossman fold protein [Clostridia bacterium]|jgi:cytokinin riboside 5'-monophosphate phosphoribohydrolase|nr:TIGR00730 family Rossman fold protein [Clostridia bacterium]MBT7121781.1 TIGR00730 family Rossman fold protein [Clostridia bacterium]
MSNICVFASSSDIVADVYKTAAKDLGQALAKAAYGVVFGAGTDGLMGQLARSAHANGGKVIGVIPDSLNYPGIVYPHCDELYDTRTMHRRKAIMESKSEAFIALPGGFGTLEEILEIITLKQLGYHDKAIVILNINGFFDHLIAQFNDIVSQSFAAHEVLTLFCVKDSVSEALHYIQTYSPTTTYQKNEGLE